MPIISIIVPVYNTEQYLSRCVNSILKQTFTDFELLLIDDGSTDTSGDVCESYANQDSRIRVFHQKNRGQAVARNFALDWIFDNSDSKYIAFVDSDDWVHPKFLELLYEGIHRFGTNICQCNHIKTKGEDIVQEIKHDYKCISPEDEYINHYSPYIWEKLYKREVWEQYRFPEGQIYEDLAIWYKILFDQEIITIIDMPLYYYYENNKSTVHKEWEPSRFYRIKAWDAQLDFLSKKSDKLHEDVVNHFCIVAEEEYYLIGKSNKLNEQEKEYYLNTIEERILRLYKNHRRQIKKASNYSWCLQFKYPFIAACYWKIKSIVG